MTTIITTTTTKIVVSPDRAPVRIIILSSIESIVKAITNLGCCCCCFYSFLL